METAITRAVRSSVAPDDMRSRRHTGGSTSLRVTSSSWMRGSDRRLERILLD
jgi:hypothetical protein